jgi:O-antigen/teichoic acid export membrane protein
MQRLIIYSALYGGTAAFQKLVGFLIFMWLARTLPVAEYAQFGLLYALQQGLATLASAGVVEATVGQLRGHSQPPARARLFASANLVFLALLLAGTGVALVSRGMARQITITSLGYASIIVCGVILAATSFRAQIVRLEENHRRSVLLSCLPPLGSSVGGFVGCVLTRSLPGFCVGSALGAVGATAALYTFGGSTWHLVLERGLVRPIVTAAAPFALVAFLGWLSGYGTNYLIDMMLPSSEVARFTFALSLCSVMLLVSGALNQVWSPRFYRLIVDEPFDTVEAKNHSFYRVLGVALGLSGGFVTIALPWVLPILGGNLRNYQHSTVELSLLFSAYVILVPWWHCQNHFLAHGMGSAILKITLVTSLLGITTLLLLMWLLGPIGVYVGFLAQMLLRTTAMVLEARRRWPVQISLSGVGVGLAMILIGLLLARQPLVPIIPEIGYVLICAVILYTFIRNAALLPHMRQVG